MTMKRTLIGLAAALVLTLAIGAGPASAKTVYDYVYSGEYFDGSGAGKTFDEQIGGIDYDSVNHDFYVGDGGGSGTITKLSASGAGVNFSGTGVPQIEFSPEFGTILAPQVTVDQYGGANDGNIYIASGNFLTDFGPDGLPIPGTFTGYEESSCGVTPVPTDGEKVLVSGRNGFNYVSPTGKLFFFEDVGSPGLEPGVRNNWSERGKPCLPIFDAEGALYGIKNEAPTGNGRIVKMTSKEPGVEEYEVNTPTDSQGVSVDDSTGDVFIVRAAGNFEEFDRDGRLLGAGFGETDPTHSYLGLSGAPMGITVDPATHDVWIANRRDYGAGVRRVEKFEATNPHVIPDTTAISPDYNDPSGESVVLRGIVNADDEPTTDCYFEYGPTQSLGQVAPCTAGKVFSGSEDHEVKTIPVAFKKGSRYFYKLFAKNAGGQLAPSNVEPFIPQGKPLLGVTSVDRVKTDGARLNTQFDPNGGNATFHFDYGVKGGPLDQHTEESRTFGFDTIPGQFNGEDLYQPGVYPGVQLVNGLEPDKTYEFQAVVSNEGGVTKSAINEFKTYQPDSGTDTCGNALVRQQTGSSQLLDCRGYEIVSPKNAGGFDVESDIVPSQAPLDAYPRANDSLLFSMHFGVVPGVSGSPTNLGLDPYVARRGANGWQTEYVGLPADGMTDDGAFGSPLYGADPLLREFAFGGEKICAPCFADGSTNVPLRLADGELVKGMAGSADPAGDPSGTVRQPFSADGSHFVFDTTAKYETPGDAGGSVYDRDLKGGGTQVVSTLPDGKTISGGGVGELGISADGSRIVVGRLLSTDSKGNQFWHLYMHIGTNANSVDLTPGTTDGVLYDGISADGSRVFFTSADNFFGDSDASADIFETTVNGAGAGSTRLITTKGGVPSNTDACAPPNLPDSWNAVDGDGKCGAVAFAGAAGVGADGTFYFASPELLDGSSGEQDQANLYVVEPGGDPDFVTTMSSAVGHETLPPPLHPAADQSFLTGLKTPQTLAVSDESGDLYVSQTGSGNSDEGVFRFDSSGQPHKFTEGPFVNTNQIQLPMAGGESQIAVDNAPGSPRKGTLYITSNSSEIYAFSPGGEFLGSLTGFGEACGVSVDESNGDVYVGDYFLPGIWKFQPKSGGPVSNAGYGAPEKIQTEGIVPCNVEASSASHVYAKAYGTGNVKSYNKTEFTAGGPVVTGSLVAGSSTAIQSDPNNGDLYVNEGNRITQYADSGKLLQRFGGDAVSSSRGIAIGRDGHLYANNGNNMVQFDTVEPPFQPVGSPAVLHGSSQSGTHSFGDFQISGDGRYAVFASTGSLTGYPNFDHSEVYRYDTQSSTLDCASCPPTLGAPTFDTALPDHGSALSDDGRVFFTTQEALALRDTNEKTDAYEWSHGTIQLISSGISADNSGLVTVSADGKNAFFFTREVLTHEDENGNAVKIYDARENGGFVHDPERKQCAASDECHGPGTEEPGAPAINTQTGSKKATPKKTAVKCKKSQVKKNGKCVKKKKKRHPRRAR